MEIKKGTKVGYNQSLYMLLALVEVRRHNADKVVTKSKVRARCISPKKSKGKITDFSRGTIFNYSCPKN